MYPLPRIIPRDKYCDRKRLVLAIACDFDMLKDLKGCQLR
jgi:hypothetical protein